MKVDKGSRDFERIPKRKSSLEELINDVLILELHGGSVYGGRLDDYETGTIWLYDCQQPADDNSGWVEQTDRTMVWERETKIDRMPGFDLTEIKNIYGPKNKELDLPDVLSLWLNPEHKSVQTIKCSWDLENKKHSSDCDSTLHEALSLIFTAAVESDAASSHTGNVRIERAFRIVHRFIAEHGGRIP